MNRHPLFDFEHDDPTTLPPSILRRLRADELAREPWWNRPQSIRTRPDLTGPHGVWILGPCYPAPPRRGWARRTAARLAALLERFAA